MNLSKEDIASIRESYKKTIELPDLNTGDNLSQFFLCPVGLIGAGKSTVIKPLSKKLLLVRISSDEVRQILKEQGANYDQLLEIIWPIMEEFAIQGYSLAIDADCGNPKTKELITQLSKKVGAKVFWIHIDPPENFILNKLRNYKHTWLFKDGEQAVENYFQKKKSREEENTQFEFLETIDTSRPDLSDQIEHVFKLIKKSLK